MRVKYIRADTAKKQLRKYLNVELDQAVKAITNMTPANVVPRRITGKWRPGVDCDNRGADPKDITDRHYHAKYDTITCPHCETTLAAHVVVGGWYCYHCGGKFGKKNIACSRCDAIGTSRCDCEEGHYEAKDFGCNDCAYCMANCHDLSIACEDETRQCDFFELYEDSDKGKQTGSISGRK